MADDRVLLAGAAIIMIALIGVIATRMLGQELKWDGPNMRSTNAPELNAFVRREYRSGWSL